jgi:hypothetical protein
MPIGALSLAVPGRMAKMFPIWSILTSHPKLLHSLANQSRAALSDGVKVRRHMPVDGAARAPYAVHVSCNVLFSLSPFIFGLLTVILACLKVMVCCRLVLRVARSGVKSSGTVVPTRRLLETRLHHV